MNRNRTSPSVVTDNHPDSPHKSGSAIRRATAAVTSFVPGSTWLVADAPVTIQHQISTDEFIVRRIADGHIQRAKIEALRPVPKPTLSADESSRVQSLESYSPEQWQRALDREKFLGALVEGGDLSPRARAPVARALGISDRTLRRLLIRFREVDSAAAFLPLKPGAAQGTSRVNPRVERLIAEEVEKTLQQSPDAEVDGVHRLIHDAARALGLKPPARSTIARRMRRAKQRSELLPAEIGQPLRYKSRPVRGAIGSEGPLSVVEIDHTIADVHIVEPRTGRPIGRPVLTLMIDRATRVILGMVVSLEAPSRYTVGLCIHHGVMPKREWLNRIGLPDGCWPGYGLPAMIYTDNAQEFHSISLQRACQVYGIQLAFRPPGHPAAGGIIERVIGTFMTKVRLLPGATFSKLLGEAPRNSQRRASLSRTELEQYIAREVSRYHKTKHATLGMPPLTAWEQLWTINGQPTSPRLPADGEQLRLSILPGEWRTITREGIQLFGLHYQAEELRPWICTGRKTMVRFDPTNLSTVFAEIPNHGHVGAHLARTDGASFSRWELNEISAWQREKGGDRDPAAIAADIRANRELIAAKARSSDKLRDARRQARQESWAQPTEVNDGSLRVLHSRPVEGPLDCWVGYEP